MARVVVDVAYNAKDSDFKPQLGQIKTAGAEGIFIPGYYNEVGTIARQAKNDLAMNIPLMGGDGWDSEKLVEGAGGPGGALEGAYFSTHYSKDDKSPKVQDFVKAFTAKTGKAPASLVAQGYDGHDDPRRRHQAGGARSSARRFATPLPRPRTTRPSRVRSPSTVTATPTQSAVVLKIKVAEFAFEKTVQPK